MTAHVSRTKTSIDILLERDTLRARVEELESAMAQIRRETEKPLGDPGGAVITLCRIDTVARGVVADALMSTTQGKHLR